MASNSYTLEVIANTAKYQSELAKIPGLTEKQAAAAALKMAQAQEKAQQQMAAAAEKASRQAADSQIDAMDEVADAAEAAARRQSEAAEKAADGFGKVGESAGKLGGVLEMLGVEGASTIADLADAGEVAAQAFGGLGGSVAVLGPILTVAGTAAALLGGSLWVLSDAASATTAEMREGALKADEYAAALQRVQDAQAGTSAALKAAANQIATMTGGLSDAEAAASEAANAIQEQFAPELLARAQALSLAMQNLQKAQAKLADTGLTATEHAQAQKDVNAYSVAVKAEKKALEELKGQMYAAMGTVSELTITQGEATETTKASTAARVTETDATQKQTAALASLQQITAAAQRSMLTAAAQQAAAVQDQLTAIDALEAASGDAAAAQAARDAVAAQAAKDADTYAQQQVEALQALTAAATEGLRSEEEIAAAKLQLDLDAIDRQANMAAEAIRLAGGTEAQITAIYEQALAARRAAELSYEKARKDSEKETEKESENRYIKAGDQVVGFFSDATSNYLDMVSNITTTTENAIARAHERGDTQMEMSLERRLKSQKKAALVGYRIQQAADIAQATMSTIKGASDAFNSVFSTVPYPANLVLAPVTAGLVAGAGAAQIAAIASTPAPSFRTGGVVPQSAPSMPGGYQDQRLISAEPGERIYNKQESAAIDRMLAGGSGPMVVQQVYRGRVVGQVVYDELQRAGRLRSALAGTKNAARANPYIR